MKLKACVNGPRTRRDHPAVPVTAEQIANESVAAVSAGAEAIHVHPKNSSGTDSLEAEHVAAAVDAARTAGVPVGVTTGAWSTPDLASRLRAIASWTVLPDFASVNWHEEGAAQVASLLLDRGVGVEAGLWNVGAAELWLASGLKHRCVRALLEVQSQDPIDVAQQLLRLMPAGIEILLHGEGSVCWDVLRIAVSEGVASRIGLEDTLILPDGSRASGNAALVTAALGLWPDTP